MAGTMQRESETPPTLVTSREPKGPKRAGAPGGIGDQALKDAIALIIGAWVVLFLLGFTLRGFNI
jgi:uncharacterized protein (DUF2236 family)